MLQRMKQSCTAPKPIGMFPLKDQPELAGHKHLEV